MFENRTLVTLELRFTEAGPQVTDDRLSSLGWDQLDIAIARELSIDGRRSWRDLARTLDAPEATIRFRARRLIDSGILRIFAFVDWGRVAGSTVSDIFLKVRAESRPDAIAQLSAMDEVQYVASCVGFADIYLQAVFSSTEEMQVFTTQAVPQVPGFVSSRTLVELMIHKASNLEPGRE